MIQQFADPLGGRPRDSRVIDSFIYASLRGRVSMSNRGKNSSFIRVSANNPRRRRVKLNARKDPIWIVARSRNQRKSIHLSRTIEEQQNKIRSLANLSRWNVRGSANDPIESIEIDRRIKFNARNTRTSTAFDSLDPIQIVLEEMSREIHRVNFRSNFRRTRGTTRTRHV